MVLTTVLQSTDYQQTRISEVSFEAFHTINPFVKWNKVSIGGRSIEDLKPNTIFIPSDGILSHSTISLTDSLLKERKDELEREERKSHQCND